MTPAAAAPSPVAVIGMHRSGTSCLAGSLEDAGLFLGEVNTQAKHNARGNRENRRIMALHEAVLADNDAAWDRPVATVTWSPARRQERDALIAGFPRAAVWGFKDPRTLLCLDGWREALPDLRLVGTFRHPAAVAASLETRGLPAGFAGGLTLWGDYNRRLLALAEAGAMPLIDYDWPAPRYRQRVAAIAAGLGLAAAGAGFHDEELRHQHGIDADPRVPTELVALHARLQALAADQERSPAQR